MKAWYKAKLMIVIFLLCSGLSMYPAAASTIRTASELESERDKINADLKKFKEEKYTITQEKFQAYSREFKEFIIRPFIDKIIQINDVFRANDKIVSKNFENFSALIKIARDISSALGNSDEVEFWKSSLSASLAHGSEIYARLLKSIINNNDPDNELQKFKLQAKSVVQKILAFENILTANSNIHKENLVFRKAVIDLIITFVEEKYSILKLKAQLAGLREEAEKKAATHILRLSTRETGLAFTTSSGKLEISKLLSDEEEYVQKIFAILQEASLTPERRQIVDRLKIFYEANKKESDIQKKVTLLAVIKLLLTQDLKAVYLEDISSGSTPSYDLKNKSEALEFISPVDREFSVVIMPNDTLSVKIAKIKNKMLSAIQRNIDITFLSSELGKPLDQHTKINTLFTTISDQLRTFKNLSEPEKNEVKQIGHALFSIAQSTFERADMNPIVLTMHMARSIGDKVVGILRTLHQENIISAEDLSKYDEELKKLKEALAHAPKRIEEEQKKKAEQDKKRKEDEVAGNKREELVAREAALKAESDNDVILISSDAQEYRLPALIADLSGALKDIASPRLKSPKQLSYPSSILTKFIEFVTAITYQISLHDDKEFAQGQKKSLDRIMHNVTFDQLQTMYAITFELRMAYVAMKLIPYLGAAAIADAKIRHTFEGKSLLEIPDSMKSNVMHVLFAGRQMEYDSNRKIYGYQKNDKDLPYIRTKKLIGEVEKFNDGFLRSEPVEKEIADFLKSFDVAWNPLDLIRQPHSAISPDGNLRASILSGDTNIVHLEKKVDDKWIVSGQVNYSKKGILRVVWLTNVMLAVSDEKEIGFIGLEVDKNKKFVTKEFKFPLGSFRMIFSLAANAAQHQLLVGDGSHIILLTRKADKTWTRDEFYIKNETAYKVSMSPDGSLMGAISIITDKVHKVYVNVIAQLPASLSVNAIILLAGLAQLNETAEGKSIIASSKAELVKIAAALLPLPVQKIVNNAYGLAMGFAASASSSAGGESKSVAEAGGLDEE